MSQSSRVQIQIPEAFEDIFIPKRYKVYYGGRGGAKSHNIARYLLIEGMRKPQRYLCARELQGTITDSVHKLLTDIISDHGLGSFYEVQKAAIKGKNGTEFFFKGLKHNATEIKSMEGVDKVWVEEAEKVSANSWEILIPTIRKDGSEIIISFNPKHPTDPTFVKFVANADDNMLVKRVSWRDNPFFPAILEMERVKLKKDDYKAYSHVWEGEFDERHFGGIYASYVNDMREQGRICPAPYKDGLPVITAWDLGKSDTTCIWFCQVIGLQPRIIDYYENNQEDLAHYANMMREKPYKNYVNYLPHDAAHERLGMAQGSISNQLRQMGIENKILQVSSVAARIESGRSLLKEGYVDDTKCKDGIHALMNYQYEWDDNKGMFKTSPLHDWSSDPSDAFGYLAQALAKESSCIIPRPHRQAPSRGTWMS